MEFTPRGSRGSAPQPAPAPHHSAPQPAAHGRRKHIDWATRTVRFELFIVIVGSALLLAAVSLYLALNGGTPNSEAQRVNKSNRIQTDLTVVKHQIVLQVTKVLLPPKLLHQLQHQLKSHKTDRKI
jgi:hypothetical protein